MSIMVSQMVKEVNKQLTKVEAHHKEPSLPNQSPTPTSSFIEMSLKKLTSYEPLSDSQMEAVFARQEVEEEECVSNPSTIQKASEHSDNKSESLRQLDELQ